MDLIKLLKTLASLIAIVFAYAYAQHSDEQHELQVAQVIEDQAVPWDTEKSDQTSTPIGSAKWTR